MIKDIRYGFLLGAGGALVLVVVVWAWLALSNTAPTEAASLGTHDPQLLSPAPVYYNETE